jgi:phage head maturation protease
MSDELTIKSFTFEVKDAEKGLVEAVVATLGVVDKDEDIIRPDAIKDGSKVSMSSYGHDAMYGNAPVGKGEIVVEGNKAVFKGRLFLATANGRDTFETLKEMGSDQQWSFGFRILGSEVPEERERKLGARRILTKLDCFEVSPVIIGAGVGTRTLAVKSAETAPPPPDPAVEAARLEAERKERANIAAREALHRTFERGNPAMVR